MPNSNSSQQTTDDNQQPNVTFPSVSVEDTLPPTITTTTTTTSNTTPQDTVNPSPASSIPEDNGSAAPSNDLDISGVVGTTPPKKKFAGGKIIATILGLFLLVGGVGAGVFLTNQNQDIREKAGENGCNQYEDRNDCANQCSPIKSDDKSYKCEWKKDSCVDSENLCNPEEDGGGGVIGGGDYCDANGCSCDKCTTDPDCFVVRYTCDNRPPGGNGCNENGEAPKGSYTFDNSQCGKFQQIDIKCGNCNPQISSDCFVSKDIPECENPVVPTALCSNVKAYNTGWTLLSTTQLSSLKAGESVNFCVNGVTTAGSFDKARFTINGAVQAETTNKRPGSNDFCQTYVIPTGVTTFNVTAQIHHITLGWK